MTRQPDVAVLTIAKGRHAHLANLLRGLAQGSPHPARCVVLDLNPEPAALPPMPFPLLHHHQPASGLPLAAARNQAAALADTPFLIFLDVDCIPAPELVGVLADALARRDALYCCEVRYLDAATPATPEAMAVRGHPHPHRPFPPQGEREEPNAGLFWSLAFGIRAESFGRLGGFDTRFTGYGAEDTDLGFRARQAGLPLVLTAETRAFHQYHPVYDPPLQHFNDILANARLFRDLHGVWPMDGWMAAFARMGLIDWQPEGRLRLIRAPTAAEIAAAAQGEERAF